MVAPVHRRKQRSSSLVLVFLALAALGGSAAGAAEPAVITGRVTDRSSGQPMAGVEVAGLGFEDGAEAGPAITDADGRYRLEIAEPSPSYAVFTRGTAGYVDEIHPDIVCRDGAAFYTFPYGHWIACFDSVSPAPVPAISGTETGGIDFALDAGGWIAGRITAAETGEPYSQAQVLISDLDARRVAGAYADPEGFYRVDRLRAGEYLVNTAVYEDAATNELFDGLPCGWFPGLCAGRDGGTPVRVELGRETGGIDFRLQRSGSIAGTVVDAETGEPIPLLTVRIVGDLLTGTDTTDFEGRYGIGELPRGAYRLTTEAPDIDPWANQIWPGTPCTLGLWQSCGPSQGDPVEVRSGEAVGGIDFALQRRAGAPCTPSPIAACLAGGRFQVSVTGGSAEDGLARLIPLTGSTSAFSFFAADNPEVVVRVIDACATFDRFWVFAAGLSHLFAGVEVVDTVSGEIWRTQSNGFHSFVPHLDTDAFATCGAEAERQPFPEPGALAGPGAPSGSAPAEGSASASCVPSAARLCLSGGRFAVEADWQGPAGDAGPATAVTLGDRAGFFWFFRASQPELVVKVLDACRGPAPRGHWFFAAGLTDLGVSLRVTDLASGASREYLSPPGTPFAPVQDTGTFGVCLP